MMRRLLQGSAGVAARRAVVGSLLVAGFLRLAVAAPAPPAPVPAPRDRRRASPLTPEV